LRFDGRYHLAIVQASTEKKAGHVAPDSPLFTLRGASVAVDARRASRVALILCLIALVAVSGALFVVGARKNGQINELRKEGIPITVTVTKCIGLLGGSGSNAAGYACRGSYTFDGTRYEEAIPGNVNRAPGSRVSGVITPDNPSLLSTRATVRSERTSWRVFIAPGVLMVIAVAATLALAFRRARHPAT
jgi:hypothetical protein